MIYNILIGDYMSIFCKNCGAELEDGSVFCDECGAKVGEVKHSAGSYSSTNPFNRYNIKMIEGERIIRVSEIHPNCLILPATILLVGFVFSLISAINFASNNYFQPTFFGYVSLFLLNPLIIIGLIWLIIRYIAFTNTDLILTNKRVFGKCGLISTVQMQCPLDKINSVSYSNGLIGKLLGYGTVIISTASTHFKFRFIRDGQTLYSDIFNHFEIAEKDKMIENAEAIADAIGRRIE